MIKTGRNRRIAREQRRGSRGPFSYWGLTNFDKVLKEVLERRYSRSFRKRMDRYHDDHDSHLAFHLNECRPIAKQFSATQPREQAAPCVARQGPEETEDGRAPESQGEDQDRTEGS